MNFSLFNISCNSSQSIIIEGSLCTISGTLMMVQSNSRIKLLEKNDCMSFKLLRIIKPFTLLIFNHNNFIIPPSLDSFLVKKRSIAVPPLNPVFFRFLEPQNLFLG